jgi:hypothetical protein
MRGPRELIAIIDTTGVWPDRKYNGTAPTQKDEQAMTSDPARPSHDSARGESRRRLLCGGTVVRRGAGSVINCGVGR